MKMMAIIRRGDLNRDSRVEYEVYIEILALPFLLAFPTFQGGVEVIPCLKKISPPFKVGKVLSLHS